MVFGNIAGYGTTIDLVIAVDMAASPGLKNEISGRRLEFLGFPRSFLSFRFELSHFSDFCHSFKLHQYFPSWSQSLATKT